MTMTHRALQIRTDKLYLIKVSDDLVEQPEALHSLVVGLQLHVELGKIADGGEHDGHALAGLVVQLVVAPLTRQEVSSYVFRQNIVEEAAIVGLQLLHLLLLLGGLGGKVLCQTDSASIMCDISKNRTLVRQLLSVWCTNGATLRPWRQCDEIFLEVNAVT